MLILSAKPTASNGRRHVLRRGPVWLLAIGMTAFGAIGLPAAEPIPVEYLWQSEPDFDFDWFRAQEEFTPSARAQQIGSPSAAQRMEAAQAIVRVPNNPDFDKAKLHSAVWKRLEAGESQPSVRAELVAAFCALDDGSSADKLWNLLSDDGLVLPTLEKACIRWRKALPLDIWRTRIRERQGSQQELARAIEGIGGVGTQADLALLSSLVTDGTQPPTLRLAAADAIGRLSDTQQLTLARELRASTAMHADLLAVAVLGKQAGAEINAFVADIAQNGTDVAQRRAYQRMCQLDPETAQAKAADYSQHADAEIRRLSILQINQTDNPEAITVLVRALSDVNPSLRDTAREELLARTSRSENHKRAVEEAVAEGLQQTDAKALEHCIRLTVELEQSQHIPRLLELLDDPQPQVCITAAWALRHLASEESTLAAMHRHALQLVERMQAAPEAGVGIEEFERRRVAHLLEAFGQRHYEPAKEMLMLFVPKNQQRMGMITRMAGIWACGRIWEGKENRALADELCLRIADKTSMFPEPEGVRYSATLALGWLADAQTRGPLVTYNEDKPRPIGYATEWALARIDSQSAPAENAPVENTPNENEPTENEPAE